MARGPNARAIDAAAAAVDVDGFHQEVEIVGPAVDHVVAEENFGEAGAVCLDLGIAAIAFDGCAAAEDHRAVACFEDGSTGFGFAGIQGERLAWHTGFGECREDSVRRPRLLWARLED